MKYLSKATVLLLIAALCFGLLAGCQNAAPTGGGSPQSDPVPQPPLPVIERESAPTPVPHEPGSGPKVEITMASGGKILIELDPEAAPVSVENFLKLVGEGFYDGLTFHRVIPNFMIQGGCPDGTGMGGPGYGITGEFASNGWENPIAHERGVISMARSSDPNSAGSQFFITVAEYPSLDGEYAAFGYVLSGMEVADEIATVKRDSSDKPLEPVVIESIKVVE